MFEITTYRSKNKVHYKTYCEFKHRWAKELFEVSQILEYLSTYPEELKILGLENPINATNLDRYQADWLNLYNKWDHRETDFFEPHWVSIKSEEFEYYIDLSDPLYPVFSCFFCLFNNDWRKMDLYSNVNILLFLCDDADQLIDLNKKTQEAQREYYQERINETNEQH